MGRQHPEADEDPRCGLASEIVGVTNDFDFFLGSGDLTPFVIRPYFEEDPNRTIRFLIVNIQSANLQATVSEIEKIWNIVF